MNFYLDDLPTASDLVLLACSFDPAVVSDQVSSIRSSSKFRFSESENESKDTFLDSIFDNENEHLITNQIHQAFQTIQNLVFSCQWVNILSITKSILYSDEAVTPTGHLLNLNFNTSSLYISMQPHQILLCVLYHLLARTQLKQYDKAWEEITTLIHEKVAEYDMVQADRNSIEDIPIVDGTLLESSTHSFDSSLYPDTEADFHHKSSGSVPSGSLRVSDTKTVDPLDSALYHYSTYSAVYPKNLTGSFVPIELKVLVWEIRSHRGDQSVLNEMFACVRPGPTTSDPGSRSRIQIFYLGALCSFLLHFQKYDAALDIAWQIMGKNYSSTPSILFFLVRIFLHLGDIANADRMMQHIDRVLIRNDMFSQRDSHICPDSAEPDSFLLQAMSNLHRGLVFAAQGEHQEALDAFEQVLSLGSDVYFSAHAASSDLSEDISSMRDHKGCYPFALQVTATNNAAISMIYQGRIYEAIKRLEVTLKSNPEIFLDEGLVFNLCTLYDLYYPDSSSEKKRQILKLAERFSRQAFDMAVIGI